MNIRKNKKYLKTDEKIQKAMMSLLERKAFEKILITDIVKEASIDRSTFYEHYQDINQLMITIEKNLVEKIKRIFDYSFDYSIEEFIEYFEFVKENKDFYLSVFKNNYDHPLAKTTYKEYISVHNLKYSEDINGLFEIKYHHIFLSSGLFSITHSWVISGMKETPKQMAEIFFAEYTHNNCLIKQDAKNA